MTDLEVLQATRALIADEEHFTTRSLARNDAGCCCNPSAPEASSWCLMGAWQRLREPSTRPYENYTNHQLALRMLCGRSDLFHVNDDLGHAAVLEMLDQAIERCTT
jgi:hypothetical protein